MKNIIITSAILLALTGCNDSASREATTAGPTAKATTSENIDAAADNIKDITVIEAQKAKNTAIDAGEKVGDKTSEVWGKTKETATNIKDTVSEKSGQAWDKTRETTTDVKDTVSEKSSQVWDSTKQAATDAKNKTDDFMETESAKLKNETEALKQKAESGL